MRITDRKIKLHKGNTEIEILDKDSKRHLIYATIIGVSLYLCILSIIGIK